MRRHTQLEDARRSDADRGTGVVVGRRVFITVTAQQADDTALHCQLALLDLGIVEGRLETLLQIEGLRGHGVAQGPVSHGSAAHGDDKHIGTRLSHVDIAAAGVGAAVPLRCDVAVPRAEHERDRRRRGWGRLDRDVHGCSRRHGRFFLRGQRERQEHSHHARRHVFFPTQSRHHPFSSPQRKNERFATLRSSVVSGNAFAKRR